MESNSDIVPDLSRNLVMPLYKIHDTLFSASCLQVTFALSDWDAISYNTVLQQWLKRRLFMQCSSRTK